MQTFLPYPSFVHSAQCLDYRRLGKQRVEAWQIYNAITKGTGWKHHPIVKMWKGYEKALLFYGMTMCMVWKAKGYVDNMFSRFQSEFQSINGLIEYPKWLFDEEFHASHRSNLLRKNKEYYYQFNWQEPDNLPYKWFT